MRLRNRRAERCRGLLELCWSSRPIGRRDFCGSTASLLKVQRSVPRTRPHRESLAIIFEVKLTRGQGSGNASLTANSTGLIAFEQRPNGTAAAAASPGGTAAHAAEQGMATAVVLSAAGHVTPCVLTGAVVGPALAVAFGVWAVV